MQGKASAFRAVTMGVAALGIVVFGLGASLGASAQASAPASKHGAVHPKPTIVRDGYRCTVVSSAKHHNLVGKAGSVVCALSGNNTLTASGSGEVVLIAGPGTDTLRASSSSNSNDVLLGGRGKAHLYAGSHGRDTLSAGSGADWFNCGNGGSQVTVVGVGSHDNENGDCHRHGVDNSSQHYHGTVTALASDNSTVSVSVSFASNGAQAWLATQSPTCDLTNLTFDLTTTPATIHVQGGGALAVGDDIGIEANAGTMNCEPVAVNVWAAPPGGNGNGDQSQHWHGTVTGLGTNNSTMTVSVSKESDGARAWLAAQNPACDTSSLTFDLTSGPANIEVDNGGTLAVGDHVRVESTSGATNCVPVAVVVHARSGGNDHNGNQRWEGTIGALASDGSTMTVSVSDQSDSAQAWLDTQNPACDTSNLVFDLTTTPANINVDGGGPLAVGDNVEVDSVAGTVNCEPVAVNVNAEAPDGGGQGGHGNDQWWKGTVGAVATDGSTITISVSDQSDSAQTWLNTQSPTCDTANLVFDLTTGPANVYVDGGGSPAVGDIVHILSTPGTVNCEPVALDVYDHAGGGGGGQGGGNGGGCDQWWGNGHNGNGGGGGNWGGGDDQGGDGGNWGGNWGGGGGDQGGGGGGDD